MSYLVDSVEIHELWCIPKKIYFKCDKDFNFIIGDNGTGKTTIINLLTAVLTGNIENLRKIQFSSATIYFNEINSRKKPSIKVVKSNQETYEISYEFKHAQSSEPLVISHSKSTNFFENLWGLQNPNTQTPTGQIKKNLNDFINISFLPIHRFIANEKEEKEIKNSSIDLKMDELNENLVKFFSKLSKEYTDCISEFQKKTLLSVLTPEKNPESLVSKAREINIADEKKALLDMFSVLGMNKKEHERKMETHLSLFDKARTDVEKRGGLTISDLLHIYNTWRTHSLVQEYELLQQEKQKIFQQKNLFLRTISAH